MLKALQNHIDKNLAFLKDARLLIALSGGLDSVVLTHLCHDLKLNITLAHCNFNLRGEESNEDEEFVLKLANDLNIEVFIESFDTETYAKNNKLSIQMAARQLRYNWFDELVESLGFDYLLTAHHADDNLETFLINLSRGTGLDGLTGIPENNSNVVRPMLPFSREEIEAYALKENLKWREDSSNTSTKYLRNKLRHEVIPILKGINPQMLQNFEKTQLYLEGSKEIIEDTIAKIQKKVVSVENNVIRFNIKKLKKLSNPKVYLYELLKDFNFTEWDDVVNLLSAQSGKQVSSNTHRLVKDRDYLLLTEVKDKHAAGCHSELVEESLIIEENIKQLQTPFGVLLFDEADALFSKQSNVIHVDKDKLKYPLIIRQWKKGDYFFPLGMKGRKKLSKYFKDEKLSLVDKERVWLLTSENKIVWVIGMRADRKFKVDSNTKKVLKIELKQSF
ncbi:tRNA lysidine(34) synthetase TilS [Ichthyenterobacterium magnum]|uniref:tRNA(Ile)-lysidine synthase n=1 Tax=Ichthyenterobacterium magnum TaxID=1230530 RepID=A0A420DLM0_9FLAO|nr:tRNA lysidine(34) synthetase TilS [Ichthyenterobacterium magnum]RKE95142.1 tRNA(Ile)-lysidine synthase [Ichthyenterobacterium magnum]